METGGSVPTMFHVEQFQELDMADAKGASKSRLGRGLSSLIKVSVPQEEVAAPAVAESVRPAAAPVMKEVVTVSDGKPVEVVAEMIRVNPHQPRKTFPEALLKELAESIKANGVIQPLVVKKLGEGGYELVAGERRLRASKLAGLKTVPCVVKEVDALTQAQMALVENIQREDLNPLERAEGYRTLMAQLGLTQHELAGRMGEERSTIANHLRLLDLAEPVKKMLKEGVISFGHAKLIASMPDVLEQEKLAKLVVLQGLSVRNLEKIMAGRITAPPAQAEPDSAKAGRELHYQELEKSIARQIGFKVKLAGGKKGSGKITIQYANLDQFDQLMQRLRVDVD